METMDPGPVGAVILAVAGLVSLGAAFLIIIHNARNKGRSAAMAEADDLEALLIPCRARKLEADSRVYVLTTALVEHGIKPPP